MKKEFNARKGVETIQAIVLDCFRQTSGADDEPDHVPAVYIGASVMH